MRSHTLELLESFDDKQNRVESCWNDILSKTVPQVDNFLHSYFISHMGSVAPKRDLFNKFRTKYFISSDPPLVPTEATEVESKVSNLHTEAKIYSKLAAGSWPYDHPSASRWEQDRLFRLIKILKHTLGIPFLMSIYHCLDERMFTDVVLVLERFVFRYITIVGAHEGRLAEKYHKHCLSIRQSPSTFNKIDLQSDLQILIKSHADDELFKNNLSAKLVYSDSSIQKRRIKHFLTSIDDHHKWFRNGANGIPKPDKIKSYDLDQITLEHIYPQNPQPAEQNAFLDSVKHNLGNLSFWGPTDNRRSGNKPFAQKKETYYTVSGVMMNRDLAEFSKWNECAYEKRMKELLKNAAKLFIV